MRKRMTMFGAVAMALALVAAGCDDDDNGTTTDEGAAADTSEYCELAAELDEQDDFPSPEQLEEYKRLAPEEISDDAEYVADAFIGAGDNPGAAFNDPEVEERFGRIEAFEADACGFEPPGETDEDEGDPEPAEGAEVIEVVGTEYAFEGVPEQIAAGPVAFRLTNEGDEPHELFVGKLAEGRTIEEALEAEDPFEEGIVTEEVGGIFARSGETSDYLNADLEAGSYGMVCFIPGPGGQPHAAHGMALQFTVA